MTKLHDKLGELKERLDSSLGWTVALMTDDVIDLIEDRNALYEALKEAERKLNAYVGVCDGDKELTEVIIPLVRAALAKAEGRS